MGTPWLAPPPPRVLFPELTEQGVNRSITWLGGGPFVTRIEGLKWVPCRWVSMSQLGVSLAGLVRGCRLTCPLLPEFSSLE